MGKKKCDTREGRLQDALIKDLELIFDGIGLVEKEFEVNPNKWLINDRSLGLFAWQEIY